MTTMMHDCCVYVHFVLAREGLGCKAASTFRRMRRGC